MNLLTPRLRLRPLHPGDAPWFYALNEDPQVLQYTGDKPFPDPSAARAFLARYDQTVRYGLGRLAVLDRQSEDVLGWCGLRRDPETNEVDLGFRFFRCYWGKGYATEAAQACLTAGWSRGVEEVIGRAMRSNKGSIHVLEKIGMQEIRDIQLGGQPAVLYAIRRPD